MKMKSKTKRVVRQFLSILAVLTILCQIPAGAASLTENTQIPTENQSLSIQGYEEDISLRSAQIKQFHFGVGGHIAAVYTDPIHYKDENGQWQEINNTLILKQNDAELYSFSADTSVSYYENTANSFKVRLPNTFKENAQIHVDYLGNSISFAPAGMVANPTANVVATADVHSKKNALLTRAMSADTEAERKALIKESSVLVANQTSSLAYANAYANTHLTYEINGQKLKESIILTAPTTQQSFSFAFTYTELTPVVQELGAVHFYAADQPDGEPVFIIEAPYMEDANTQEDTLCMDIDVTVTPTATGCIYTMTPDAEWLNDPARVYPITIDPTLYTVQSSAAIQDNGVNQYNPTTNYVTVNRMYVGSNHDGSKAYESRIYIRFPRISDIPTNAFINKATMYLYRHETSSYQSAANNIINVFEVGGYNWDTYSITWNSQKDYSFGSNPVAQTPVDIASSSGEIRDEYNVTSLVRKWYSTTASNNGLVLKPNTLDTTKTNRVCYYSSDYTVTGKMPHIEVEYFTGSETPGISDGAGYFIRNKYSNKYMEVKNFGGTGAAIIQSSFDGGANQQWCINYESGGVYSFSPKHNTDLKLDVINATDANGQNTQAFVDTGYSAQLFRIYSNGDGTYRILSAISETRALDIEGPSTADGAAVQIWTWDSTANQMKWYLESASSIFTSVENAYSSFSIGDDNMAAYTTFNETMDGSTVNNIKYSPLTKFNYTQGKIDKAALLEYLAYSDVAFLDGHAYTSHIEMKDQNGNVYNSLNLENDIGTTFKSGSTTKTNTPFNKKTKWLIIQACSQLNYEASQSASENSALKWAKALLGDGVRMHGVLSYYGGAPEGDLADEKIDKFLAKQTNSSNQLDMISAWQSANEKLFSGSSSWAAICHRQNKSDKLYGGWTANTTNGAAYTIDRYSFDNNPQTPLPVTVTQVDAGLSVNEGFTLESASVADRTFVLADQAFTSAQLQKIQTILCSDKTTFSAPGELSYFDSAASLTETTAGLLWTENQVISKAENYLNELGLLPRDNYMIRTSKAVREELDLVNGTVGPKEIVSWTVRFYQTINDVPILSADDAGIVMRITQNGLFSLQYNWKTILPAEKITVSEAGQSNVFSEQDMMEQYCELVNADEISPPTNVCYRQVYLYLDGIATPAWVYGTGDAFVNSVYFNAITGERITVN